MKIETEIVKIEPGQSIPAWCGYRAKTDKWPVWCVTLRAGGREARQCGGDSSFGFAFTQAYAQLMHQVADEHLSGVEAASAPEPAKTEAT